MEEQQNKPKNLEAQVIDCPLFSINNKCYLSRKDCIYCDPKLKEKGCWFYNLHQLSQIDYRF